MTERLEINVQQSQENKQEFHKCSDVEPFEGHYICCMIDHVISSRYPHQLFLSPLIFCPKKSIEMKGRKLDLDDIQIKSNHIKSYQIISHHIKSYIIQNHISWLITSNHITSYHIPSYLISNHIKSDQF